MDKSARSSRLVSTLAVTAVSIAAIAAAVSALARFDDPRPERPRADAPVEVVKVKAPPPEAVDRLPPLCGTCTMGAAGRRL